MVECKALEGCLFFNDKMKNMPTITELLKKQYCKDNFTGCARYMVLEAFGKEAVPTDLFPNMQDRAEALIAKK